MEQKQKMLPESREQRKGISEEDFRNSLVERMNAMTDEANEHRMLPVVVQVMTWKLAAVAYHCGPGAAGDILARLGRALTAIADREQAKREAEQALAEGRQPH